MDIMTGNDFRVFLLSKRKDLAAKGIIEGTIKTSLN